MSLDQNRGSFHNLEHNITSPAELTILGLTERTAEGRSEVQPCCDAGPVFSFLILRGNIIGNTIMNGPRVFSVLGWPVYATISYLSRTLEQSTVS
jgi:hypothetical protein